jgi:hypothetical protein
MRNTPKPLDPRDDARVESLVNYLRGLREGTVVTLTYVKRDNSTSQSTGLVGKFSGTPHTDTASITIDTTPTKGRPSTINLVGVTNIVPLN